MPIPPSTAVTFKTLLERRLAIIADHDLRERDPAEQLRQLTEVSQTLDAEYQQTKKTLPPRLRHFIEQCSFQKALAYLEEQPQESAQD